MQITQKMYSRKKIEIDLLQSLRDINKSYKAKMIYETIPQKYLVVDDMYKVFVECCVLVNFIEFVRENLSNLLIADDISDRCAFNMAKSINDYTNLINHLIYICQDFYDETKMDEDKYEELYEVRYICERNEYKNKLNSLDTPKLIHETLIDEYNIHIVKMVNIMNGSFSSGYEKKQVITDGLLKEVREVY